MKRIVKMFLLIIIFILSTNNVYAMNIDVENISVSDKSDTTKIGEVSIIGNDINADIAFSNISDYVTFEIKFKNNDEETYKIDSITDDNKSEYIKSSYNYDESLNNPIFITLKYDKELTGELDLKDINISINLLDDKGKEQVLNIKPDTIIINPNTSILLSVILSIISISLVGFIYFRYYKKKTKTSIIILILGLLSIPISAIAIKLPSISLTIKTDVIQILPNPWEIVEQQVPGTLSIGDELKIDNQYFYVISSNENKTTLLSKYNLNVGDNKNPNVPEGIQDESIIGWNKQNKPKYGDIYFSESTYWYNNGLKSEYGTNFPIYVYDNNSYLYEHIENYILELKKLGAGIINGRILSYEDLSNLGCANKSCTTAPEWVYLSSYWSGTAENLNSLWVVLTSGAYNNVGFHYNRVGVRPVIEVPTSDIDL